MTKLPTLIIGGQILGLLVVQGLELWRPGSVSSIVPIGAIWLVATITSGVTALLSIPRLRSV